MSIKLQPKHIALFAVSKDNTLQAVVKQNKTKLTLEVNKEGDTINIETPKDISFQVGSVITFTTNGDFVSVDNSNVKDKTITGTPTSTKQNPIYTRPNN